jgi:rhodanese-related sulfurtransferase
LPPEAYEKFHLPGAMNVPLNESFSENVQLALPNKGHEVIVYCQNEDCGASPEAAKELESLGYTRVYDYAAGKDEWRRVMGS